ncbi:MAG: transposase [Rhodospirillaceae bacterium]|nr:MAG: transposase [Rhodospirillaceae bacterium]
MTRSSAVDSHASMTVGDTAAGKPTQYAFIECFNGKLRDECLNETLFTTLAHTLAELAEWQHDYNTVRPHSKLGGRTPAEIARQAAKYWKDSTSAHPLEEYWIAQDQHLGPQAALFLLLLQPGGE